ncbi:hypothetical protein PhiH1_065 [Halobacterium phage phiH]|uniref:Uncharacterized protein n=1 Tax=Halobacterium phage phiH TaxID=169684 RepID=A0A3G1ZKP9_BPPHH|nr:hypothetical protein JR051_gp14 [Halobacterium phage phiH]AYM00260.1 hypothetical protein PhiH1_065 [Halobacterium phage phiH]
MIDNYDDRNREETLDAVSDFSAEQLDAFIEFEKAHKDRKTVVEPLERELLTVTSVGRNYVAGVWFDDVDEEKVVRQSRRIEQAIDAGDLKVVG